MSLSMEEKLQRRKLDALRRGVHRVGDEDRIPFCVNLVGVGKAGADIVAEVLRTLPSTGPKMSALVIDIGDQDLKGVREAARGLPADRADVEIIELAAPSRSELLDALGRYPEFLKLEYPMAHGTPDATAWLPSSIEDPRPAAGVARAYAKAVYARAYYDGERSLKSALSRFGTRVEASQAQSIVCTVFGMAGGVGGGMIVDLVRHLSNVIFGRQALMVGLGVLPCGGDAPMQGGAAMYPLLNELDCFGDEGKNQGVVTACGELFRNPFTAGLLVVPQQHVWESTRDLAATHERVTSEIASLLTARGGANLWETLRLLNWVAAPSTQHSAARTPWGPKWIHMLGFGDGVGGGIPLDRTLPARLGLLPTFQPEFIELRVAAPDAPEAAADAAALEAAFSPDVPPQVAGGGREGSVQFILPSIAKTDLDLFYTARDAYDATDESERTLDHALLLERGVLLSEPSTRLEGMAGASLPGSDGWIAVPFDDLRGGPRPAPQEGDAARPAHAA